MPFQIRIDASTIPALIFGGLLLVAAMIMGGLVYKARRSLDAVVENDEAARLHADRQFRRRIQVTVMLALVGILIPLGDQLEKFLGKNPALFFVWVACVFVLTVCMVLMALGDWLSTAAYSAVARSQLRQQRTELEEEIRRYHASRNNPVQKGHSQSIEDGEES
jgi:hypothetical protein